MDVSILYAGLSAVTGTELITPSEAAARNITSEPIAVDHVFEYTYNPVRPTFQQHLKYPPREWVDLKVKTVTGAVTSVFVKKDYTLAQVKEAIEKEHSNNFTQVMLHAMIIIVKMILKINVRNFASHNSLAFTIIIKQRQASC